MASPKNDKTVAHILRGGSGKIKLEFKADTIKITEQDKTKKAKNVSIRLSTEEVEEIWKKLNAKRLEGCFSETTRAPDSWDLFFEERQV